LQENGLIEKETLPVVDIFNIYSFEKFAPRIFCIFKKDDLKSLLYYCLDSKN